MSKPRKHHYVPQCYLRNFSINQKLKQVFLLDLKQKKECKASIKDIAQRRDFFRVDIDGVDPNIVEKSFSKLEDQISCSIKMIANGGQFTGDVKINILNLIALLIVRSPQKRSLYAEFHARTAKLIMEISLTTKQRWEAQMEKFPADKRVSYEIAKEFFESQRYTIQTPRETHIRNEFLMFDTVLPYLFDRKWQLITSSTNSQLFFTSDNPVSIDWDEPEKVPAIFRSSPGYGMVNTTISFPLTSNHFLIGRFDVDRDGYVNGTDEMVGVCNLNTILNSYEQIFSSSLDAYIKTDITPKYFISNIISNLK